MFPRCDKYRAWLLLGLQIADYSIIYYLSTCLFCYEAKLLNKIILHEKLLPASLNINPQVKIDRRQPRGHPKQPEPPPPARQRC